ncbi:unnamed protein product [Amaranthus hypochondriacus]
MGRVRGKSKKQTVAAHKDVGSEKEEKIPASKRRGRPQKPMKDEVEDEEIENGKCNMTDKSLESDDHAENGAKRKRSLQVKENSNGLEAKSVANDSVKPVGFRQIGSRRKNKPRRAAEVGVECN